MKPKSAKEQLLQAKQDLARINELVESLKSFIRYLENNQKIA